MLLSFTLALNAEEMTLKYSSDWKISASSGGNSWFSLFDGNKDTMWHSTYKSKDGVILSHDECPFTIDVNFGEEKRVSGFHYIPRQDGNGTGAWYTVDVYSSNDGENYELIYQGDFAYEDMKTYKDEQRASWGNRKMSAIRLVITSSVNGYGTGAELTFLQNTERDSHAVGEPQEEEEEIFIGGEALPVKKEWEISFSSSLNDTYLAAYDGSDKSFWQSDYTVKNGEIASYDKPTFYIDVDFGGEETVSGFTYTPVKESIIGYFSSLDIYGSEDGINYSLLWRGSFDYGEGYSDRGVKTASWGDAKLKKIKISVTKTVGERGSAAEIGFLTGSINDKKSASTVKGTKEAEKKEEALPVEELVMEGWSITASSDNSGTSVLKLLDGNENTFWHTKYVGSNGVVTSHDECPHILTVDFKNKTTVSGFRYLPRQDTVTGSIYDFNVYYSNDKKNWEWIYSSTFGYGQGNKDLGWKTASWGNIRMRYLQIEITRSFNDYGTGAELRFLKNSLNDGNSNEVRFEPGEILSEEEKAKRQLEAEQRTNLGLTGLRSVTDRTGWTVTVSSDLNQTAKAMLDGNINSYWHSKFVSSGGTVLSHDDPPFDINLTMPEAQVISGIVLSVRQDSNTGRPTKVSVYGSDKDEGELIELADGFEFREDKGAKIVEFGANVKVKRLKITYVTSYTNYGTLSELFALSENVELETVSLEECKNYSEPRRPVEIDGANGVDVKVSKPVSGDAKAILQSSSTHVQSGTDSLPVEITVDLGRTHSEVCGFYYKPSIYTSGGGFWTNTDVYAAGEDGEFKLVKEGLIFTEDKEMKNYAFEKPVAARYLKFVVKEATKGYMAVSFIGIKETQKSYNEILSELEAKADRYYLTIGENKIKKVKDSVESETELDTAPFIENGTTLIPIRGLFEEMGATVTWNEENQTIIVDDGENKLELQIWNDNIIVSNSDYKNVGFTVRRSPIIKDSRAFIPLRFISEKLGYDVTWDGETQEIFIKKSVK